MNSIILKMSDGSIIENPTIEGLVVDFRATDATVTIHEGAVFKNCKFILGAACNIEIERTFRRGLINTTVDMSGVGKNRRLHIKSGVSIEGARFAMANESDIYIEIGKNCMLSSNITFRATDGHVIFDLDSREIINRSKPIIVGDECWIGSEVIVMKNSVIAKKTIIGTRALVSGHFSEENVVLAGVPAKIVKRNCGWSRTYIDNYKKDD